jgi:peptidoglycan/xylan/chitin deacetylase (PgdA/CDA1 family)
MTALLFAPLAATTANETTCIGQVYLTIDTGSMSQAELIARVLNEENVRATFFLANEKTVRGDYSLDASWDSFWKARAQEGHAFGNHSWSHHWAIRDEGNKIVMRDAAGKTHALDQAGFCDEMKRVETAFHRATGQHLAGIWRAPGGRTTHNSVRFAASCGYPLHVRWDDSGFLGDELPSEQYPNKLLLERALKNIKGGDVLVMHTGIWSRKEPFAPVLQPLIQGLKARGLCFARLDSGTR